MRLCLALAVLAVGCGSKPARPTATNKAPDEFIHWPQDFELPRASAPRPDLGVEQLVPDLHDVLRWPLSAMSHPELEPQFEIAPVFAQPGIGWIELCNRGVQNRITSGRNRDELEYLRGWCAAIKGDADKACEKLVPLTSSTVLGIPSAVRVDVANIIASAGNIDTADKLLNKHRIRDVEIYDTLAATYVELGMERDALEMNRRSLDTTGTSAKAAEHCRRLAKEIVLSGGSDHRRLTQLEDMATKPKVPDEVCVDLNLEAKCFVGPAGECTQYFEAQTIDPRHTHLLQAFRLWPKEGTFKEWLDVVEVGSRAGDLPGAKDLVEIAMNMAVRLAPTCSPTLMRGISIYTKAYPNARLSDELKRCSWDEKKETTVSTSPVAPSIDAAPPAPSTVIVPTITFEHVEVFAANSRDAAIAVTNDVLAAVRSFVLNLVPTEMHTPAAPANCDAEIPKEKGLEAINLGRHADALAAFEESLRCKDNPYVRTLAFVEACASQNSKKATYYFRTLTPAQQSKFGQICQRQKPPVQYQWLSTPPPTKTP